MSEHAKTWAVLDCHYLCHRAFHTAGHLSYKGEPSGAAFGFLQALVQIYDEFSPDGFVFCFEHSRLYRRELFPEYKRRRKEMDYEEIEFRRRMAVQINDLRKRHLPAIGFRNIFRFRGMESDDVMAALAAKHGVQGGDFVMIVTADSDLLQCLHADSVVIYNPQKKKVFSEPWFRKEYGFPPAKWALVKSIAGCVSDNVPGISGVGEKTACRYIRQELEEKSKAYASIAEGEEIIRRNRKLVSLPWKGCPAPELVADELSDARWRKVCQSFGIRTLAGRAPVSVRKRI